MCCGSRRDSAVRARRPARLVGADQEDFGQSAETVAVLCETISICGLVYGCTYTFLVFVCWLSEMHRTTCVLTNYSNRQQFDGIVRRTAVMGVFRSTRIVSGYVDTIGGCVIRVNWICAAEINYLDIHF